MDLPLASVRTDQLLEFTYPLTHPRFCPKFSFSGRSRQPNRQIQILHCNAWEHSNSYNWSGSIPDLVRGTQTTWVCTPFYKWEIIIVVYNCFMRFWGLNSIYLNILACLAHSKLQISCSSYYCYMYEEPDLLIEFSFFVVFVFFIFLFFYFFANRVLRPLTLTPLLNAHHGGLRPTVWESQL